MADPGEGHRLDAQSAVRLTTWLHEQRLLAVREAVLRRGSETILDLGCGDGPLLTRLAREETIRHIVGVDLSTAALGRLGGRLQAAPEYVRRKVDLIQGSITEPTRALAGFDAALLVEAIEHIDPDRLSAVERAVFQVMSPNAVLITTPNRDFNALLGVPGHRLRHPDHRFEWGRAKFRSWARRVAHRNGYTVSCQDIGGAHPIHGGSSQLALFEIATEEASVCD